MASGSTHPPMTHPGSIRASKTAAGTGHGQFVVRFQRWQCTLDYISLSLPRTTPLPSSDLNQQKNSHIRGYNWSAHDLISVIALRCSVFMLYKNIQYTNWITFYISKAFSIHLVWDKADMIFWNTKLKLLLFSGAKCISYLKNDKCLLCALDACLLVDNHSVP